jgi:hypothetical protein
LRAGAKLPPIHLIDRCPIHVSGIRENNVDASAACFDASASSHESGAEPRLVGAVGGPDEHRPIDHDGPDGHSAGECPVRTPGAEYHFTGAIDRIEVVVCPACVAVSVRHADVTTRRCWKPQLFPGDPRAAHIAANNFTLSELLASARVPEDALELPRLEGLEIVVQPHCHQHAVMGFSADSALLKSLGADIVQLSGCCGLAGNFGMEKGHYEVSTAVAENSLLPALREAGEDAVFLADGFSCRTQAEQLAGKRGVHLAELLASRLPTNPWHSSWPTSAANLHACGGVLGEPVLDVSDMQCGEFGDDQAARREELTTIPILWRSMPITLNTDWLSTP